MKKYILHIIVSVIVISVAACQTTAARYDTTGELIDKSLQTSIEQNNRVMRQQQAIPAQVDAVFVPKVSIARNGHKKISQKRFDVAVTDVDVRTFYMGLAKDTPYNIIVSPEVKGKITLHLKDVTIDEVMQAARDIYGYEYRRTRYGYEILANKIETRMFVVNYLDVLRSGQTQTQGSSGQISEKISTTSIGEANNNGTHITSQETSSGSRVTTKTEMNFWKSLKESLETMLGQQNGHAVIINATAGLVIVKGYPAELRRVENYLQQLQSRVGRQVILEAKILEVILKDGYQAGIDWSLFGKGLQQTGLDAAFADTNIDSAFNQIFKIKASSIGGPYGFRTVIDLLSTQGNVQVLSSPRISTMNNQKALIKVGEDEFFVTGVSTTTTVAGVQALPTEDIELTPFFSGINLDVTPQISTDGSVTLHIHPSVSRVQDQTKTLKLRDENFSLPLAQSQIRETDTIVHAQNGQIIVLGGLMQTQMQEDIASTPVLGDIPFMGSFFRHTKQSARKTELVILLRPLLVESGTWVDELQDSRQRFGQVTRGFHVGGKTKIFGTEGERE